MKKTTLAVVLIVLIAGVGLWVQSRQGDVGRAPDTEQVGDQQPPAANSRGPTSQDLDVPSDLTDAESIAIASPDQVLIDGTVAREWGEFILAKDIRVNCRDVPQVIKSDLSGAEFLRQCDSVTVFDHPYVFFTDDQLKQIADYDAEAAYLLGYRVLLGSGTDSNSVANLEMGLTYAMKALVETGEKQAFDLLIDGRRFRDWSVWATANEVPTTAQVQEKAEEYVWHKAGRSLGFIAEEDFHWQELSDVMRRFDKYFDLDDLNRQANDLSMSISESRSRVIGEAP